MKSKSLYVMKIAALLAAVVLLMTVCGCGGNDAPADSDPAESTASTGSSDVSDDSSQPEESLPDESDISDPQGGETTAAPTTGTTTEAKRTTTKKAPAALTKVTQMSYSPAVKGLPGSLSKELLENPDRGYYMEVNVNVATGKTVAGDADGIQYMKDNIARYGEEKPQLMQNYLYLTDYSDRDLDQKAFDYLQKYFAAIRELGIQSCVRFAYEFDENHNTVGPTTEQMLRHMQQLKPFLEKNKDLIFVVQAGFIGLWGEWHHSVHDHDRKKVLEAIVDMTPAGKMVQVRLASYKNVLDANDPRRARVSYHDDYLVGTDHYWSVVQPENQKDYSMVLKDCESMILVGEMPWGTDRTYNEGKIDGWGMAQYLQKFHYSAISITHNYIESGVFNDFNMSKWKREEVTKDSLAASGLRYADSWFVDESGKTVTRSLFAYIRDYLGYYIEATGVKATVSGKTVTAEMTLKNYGFSAPYGMKALNLVITDENGKILTSKPLCGMGDLQPGKAISVKASLTASELYAGYHVGISFTNAVGTPARIASDVPYNNGVNELITLA